MSQSQHIEVAPGIFKDPKTGKLYTNIPVPPEPEDYVFDFQLDVDWIKEYNDAMNKDKE